MKILSPGAAADSAWMLHVLPTIGRRLRCDGLARPRPNAMHDRANLESVS